MSFGIRFKLILAFFVCFGAITMLSRILLDSNLTPKLVKIEQTTSAKDAERVVDAVDAELGNLAMTNRDWGNWDDMYRYVQNRNTDFVTSNLTAANLKNISLSLILILDHNGKTVYSLSAPPTDKSDASTLFHSHTHKIMALFLRQPTTQNCGFLKETATLQMICWKPILPSTGTGSAVGTLIMGRNFDAEILIKIQNQTRLAFDILPPSRIEKESEQWDINIQKYLIGSRVQASRSKHVIDVSYQLIDILGNPVAAIHMNLPREMIEQMYRMISNVEIMLGLVAIVVGSILFIILQLLLIKPLVKLQRCVVDIREQKSWDSRIPVDDHDEVGHLGVEINSLLEVIDGQVRDLEALSLTDALTYLGNRRAFDLRLLYEMHRVKRGGNPLSLIIIDIDFFKQYNDHYGHLAGDQAIQTVAQAIRASAKRGLDLHARILSSPIEGARIGGEEFAILMPETDQSGALCVAKNLQAELAQHAIPHAKSEAGALLTISIGVATTRGNDESPEQLTDRADQALYAAKKAGRNRIEIG